MRLHAYEKMKHVSPQYIFYQDIKTGMRFCTRTNTSQVTEAERLMGDSDEELVEGSERKEEVFYDISKSMHI